MDSQHSTYSAIQSVHRGKPFILAHLSIHNRDLTIMTYSDRLQRWVIVRLLPHCQHQDMAQFHKCSDAEGYCQVLRRLYPYDKFEVMFDPEG